MFIWGCGATQGKVFVFFFLVFLYFLSFVIQKSRACARLFSFLFVCHQSYMNTCTSVCGVQLFAFLKPIKIHAKTQSVHRFAVFFVFAVRATPFF